MPIFRARQHETSRHVADDGCDEFTTEFSRTRHGLPHMSLPPNAWLWTSAPPSTSARAPCHALKKVNLQAFTGEILMLVGPSGCGKTTLLSAIAGTMRVESGEIDVSAENRRHRDVRRRARPPPRRAHRLHFPTVRTSIAHSSRGGERRHSPPHPGRRQRHRSMKRSRAVLGLRSASATAVATSALTNSSGGQQQRVAIARALVHEPSARHLRRTHRRARRAERRDRPRTLPQRRPLSRPRWSSSPPTTTASSHTPDRIARMDDGVIIEEKKQTHTEPPHFVHEHAI